jgi:hypothetical protein
MATLAGLPRISPAQAVTRAASIAVILEGCVVLAGWQYHVAALRSVFPNLVAMNPATAVACILAGLALVALTVDGPSRLPRHLGRALAGAVALIALLKALSFAGWDVGVDQVLFRDELQALQPPITSRLPPPRASSWSASPCSCWIRRRAPGGGRPRSSP